MTATSRNEISRPIAMGILFIHDNAGIGCANWVVRSIVAEVASVLPRFGASELAEWLIGPSSYAELYGHLDVRELTPENQRAFLAAIKVAFLECKTRGPVGWSDANCWPGYLKLFENLAEQVAMLERGQTPKQLPNLSGVCKYDGAHSGPGWKNQIDTN